MEGIVSSKEGYILCVRNLDLEIEEEDLYELFAEWGTVTKVVLPLDRETGYVKGYGLIQFDTLEEAQAAITGLHKSKYRQKELEVGFAFKKPVSNKRSRNLREDESVGPIETESKTEVPEKKKQKVE